MSTISDLCTGVRELGLRLDFCPEVFRSIALWRDQSAASIAATEARLELNRIQLERAQALLDSFTRQMKRMPSTLRKSMTYDRGSEMACHPELACRLNIDIWYCDPHQSAGKQSPGLFPDPPHTWQRGSNENTKGLLRQFMPKGTDLSDASQTWLNDVARLMYKRPRKTLG